MTMAGFNDDGLTNARKRNEAMDAAIYARKGIELASAIIPEDTSNYVILALYPGSEEFEVLGVGTKAFGFQTALKMDRNVTICFV